MKLSAFRIASVFLALPICGALAVVAAMPELVPKPIRAQLPGGSDLASFKHLGCSDQWAEKSLTPRVWLTGEADKTTFLVMHAGSCGFSGGTHSRAWVDGDEVRLYYELRDDDGALAACYCEYWAAFALKSMPDKITRVTFDGKDALMMGRIARSE